jgi:hypothetical protein
MPIIIDNGAPAIVGAAAFGAGLGQGRAQLMQQWMPLLRQTEAQKFEAGQSDAARQNAKLMLRAKLMNEADIEKQRLAEDWNKNMQFVPGEKGKPGTWRPWPTGRERFQPPEGPQASMPAPNRPSWADTALVGPQLSSMADGYDSQYRRTLEEIRTNVGLYG